MSGPGSSSKSVLAALAANFVVTLLKFIAFLFSGSGSMLSEVIHSFADTGNQFLLFIGIKRGGRAADRAFHYGYGADRFVFGLLSASGIFFVGCGVTVYHGIHGLLTPSQPKITALTFAILGISLVIEGAALTYAVRASLQDAGKMPFFRHLKEKADPATLAVLLEDTVAVFGLLVASGGIAATYWLESPLWDSLGSIVVGVLLGAVAMFLVLENRSLLLGKAAPSSVEARFIEILRAQPSIALVHDVKTRQLTPEEYVFKAEIALNDTYLAEHLEALLRAEGSNGIEADQRWLRTVAATATRVIGETIDAIEHEVRADIPEAKHIDLEIDRGRSFAQSATGTTPDRT